MSLGGPLPARRRPHSSRITQRFTGAVAVIPLVTLIAIVGALVIDALPAIRVNGWSFLFGHGWNIGNTYGSTVISHGVTHPVGSSYGALPLIIGTLEAATIAVVIAVPLSILAALAVVERLPPRTSQAIGFLLETLAGIPSVVFGLWGALTLGPLLSHHVYPLIANNVPNVWGLSFFKGNTGNGEGLLTSGIVLAIMIVPIIAATSRDLFKQVPTLAQDGARALGMTEWEVMRQVTIPWIRAGLIGASVLGLARALGETMAVAMVSGTALGAVSPNAYSPMTTIAATIVTQLDSAFTDATGFAVHTLAEAALLLVAITLFTNIAARLLVRRVASTALPVGRGV